MATSKDDILDAIGEMTVLELNELLEEFEEKFNVTAAAPVAVSAPPGSWAANGLLTFSANACARVFIHCLLTV